jgi:hypothetical protein
MKTVLGAVARAGYVRPGVQGDEPPTRLGVTITPADGARVWWEPGST